MSSAGPEDRDPVEGEGLVVECLALGRPLSTVRKLGLDLAIASQQTLCCRELKPGWAAISFFARRVGRCRLGTGALGYLVVAEVL